MTDNQIALSKAIAKVAADAGSVIPGDASAWVTQLTEDLAAAIAAQTTKASGKEVVDDLLSLINAGATEFGNTKVVTLVTDLTKTASDLENGKLMAVIGDLIADWRAVKALKS